MIYCSCRSVSEKFVTEAFAELELETSHLNQDDMLCALYARAVALAEEAGKTVSAKPLEKRCPPCKAGFLDFVLQTVQPKNQAA